MKKIRLRPNTISKQRLAAIATATLEAGGLAPAPPRPDEPKIGAVMRDGTVHAGISPNTGTKLYVLPADAPVTMVFNDAKDYCRTQNTQKAYGHDDWRLPSKSELNLLFNYRAKIGGFNVSGSNPSGWYWSGSSFDKWGAWGQRFSDAVQFNSSKYVHSSVRLVRTETPNAN